MWLFSPYVNSVDQNSSLAALSFYSGVFVIDKRAENFLMFGEVFSIMIEASRPDLYIPFLLPQNIFFLKQLFVTKIFFLTFTELFIANSVIWLLYITLDYFKWCMFSSTIKKINIKRNKCAYFNHITTQETDAISWGLER